MASSFKSSCVAALLLHSILTAAQNSPNSTRTCSSNFHEFDHGYNASGSISMPGPRVNESYAASKWTWSKYIVDLLDSDNITTSVWQQLGLQTSPVQNLSDPSLPYTGCIIGIEDPASAGSKKAETDDGTCTSVLTPDCVQELLTTVNATASSWSGTPKADINCLDLLGTTSAGRSTSKCYDQWSSLVGTQFLPASFSSNPNPGSPGCQAVNPGDSNATNQSFFGWSDGRSDAPGNFTYYDRAIRSPTPIIVATWLKATSSSGSSIGSSSSGGWADTKMLCIPGNKTESGSRSIAEADKAASSSTPSPTRTGSAPTSTTSKPSGAGRLEGMSSGMALLITLSVCLML